MTDGLHRCDLDSPYRSYGDAVDQCYESDDGTLWVDNDEYVSQVNYCPFCGYKAKVQVDPDWREKE